MPPVGSNAPVISINPQRKVIRLRALQLIIVFAFVGCIAAASLDPGRWTYASIKATVALGSGATALTFAISIIYIVFYNELIRHSNSYSGSQRVCYLLAHMSIDATTAVLWLLAVVAALFPKQTDFRSLFKSPPYATWIASVITAALECILFVASTWMILVCYRMAPNQPQDQGIELPQSINTGVTLNRGIDMPAAGLSRSR